MAQWLAVSPHSKKVVGEIPTLGLSVWSFLVLPVPAWVLSGYCGCLPQSEDMQIRLTGNSKLPLGAKASVAGNLSRMYPTFALRQLR